MASRKSERLINLTMALLATRRYLTKSEIFRTVEGYSGSAESTERMFERDKDDLRRIGIEIEVRSLDPLFDDEPGYRIHPDSYSLNLGNLTGVEVAILSLAAEAWRGAALGQSAQSAFVKLQSLGIESDFDSLPALSPRLHIDSSNFVPLAQAILDRAVVQFSYLSAELTAEDRRVQPFGLGSRKGNWYLVGKDLARNAMRTFRIARILDEVRVAKSKDSFKVDAGFDVLSFLDANLFDGSGIAQLRIRLGKGHSLRRLARIVSTDDDFDLCEVPFNSSEALVSQILWHGDDIIIESPADLRESIVSALHELVAAHG